MVGRFSDLSTYKEIVKSKDFIRVFIGSILIPIALVLDGRINYLREGLLILSIIINGLPIVKEAFLGLIKKKVNVDELVSIAIAACLINGYYLEGAIVSAIMVIGALIEESVSDSARKEIEKLISIVPETGEVESDGKVVIKKIEDIVVGETVVIKSGEIIPLDGVVKSGNTWVDESSITGESIPVSKGLGSTVSAGTLNQQGFIKIEVTKVGEDSTINKVIKLVENAENSDIDSSRIVDKYAKWFTPVILLISVATYIVTRDITRATTVLIVGCPCSFLLTGPVTTVAAIGRAAKAGILVKGGKYLENAAKTDALYFDKTGTLTNGKPVVVSINNKLEYKKEDVIFYAATLEQASTHPLARSIIDRAKEMDIPLIEASEIENIPGTGIKGVVDGKSVFISMNTSTFDNSNSSVKVELDGTVIGTIDFNDDPRPEAKKMISKAKELGVSNFTILSGDHENAVKRIAEHIGATNYHFRLKPEEKLKIIREDGAFNSVFLGDGINDAPALKASATGIAMGLRGSDVALETADIVLMNDRLEKVPFLIKLSRKMTKTIKVNILISFGINLISLALASLGMLTPILGAISHNIGSILVVMLSASLALIKEDS